MSRRPKLALVGLLPAGDRRLAQLLDLAALEASEALGVPFERRLIISGKAAPRTPELPHGTRLEPWGPLDLRSAFLYRDSYDARRLEEAARRRAPEAFADVTVIAADVELEPPPEWRYMLFRTLGRRGAVVSLKPLHPRYWSERARDPSRVLRTRLRAALAAATGPLVGIDPCDEPGCFFDRTVDGVDALDAMEGVGAAHSGHPAAGYRFGRSPRAHEPDPLEPPPGPPPPRHPAAFLRRSARGLPIAVRWEAGPGASLETFNAAPLGPGKLKLERRHATAWAPTLRPPVDRLVLDRSALAAVRATMDRAIAASLPRGVNVPMPPSPDAPAPGAAGVAADLLRDAGARLYDLLVPPALERGLPRRGVFLSLGVDELLLDEPLELMHDGEDFLAIKHHVGRFVNASVLRSVSHRGISPDPIAAGGAALRALVVGVPESRLAPGRPLPHAAREADVAARALAALGARVTALVGTDATEAAVYEALRAGPHLLHYSGHADVDGEGGRARLLLFDGALDAASLGRAVARRPPALAVLNACESGRAFRFSAADPVRGLLDGLLAAGSYLLAARWPVGDESSATFAERLYDALLRRGEPLGAAVSRAREETRRSAPPDDLTWAAYVLYGDPRIALRPRRS